MHGSQSIVSTSALVPTPLYEGLGHEKAPAKRRALFPAQGVPQSVIVYR
jgi:hypothetical protein